MLGLSTLLPLALYALASVEAFAPGARPINGDLLARGQSPHAPAGFEKRFVNGVERFLPSKRSTKARRQESPVAYPTYIGFAKWLSVGVEIPDFLDQTANAYGSYGLVTLNGNNAKPVVITAKPTGVKLNGQMTYNLIPEASDRGTYVCMSSNSADSKQDDFVAYFDGCASLCAANSIGPCSGMSSASHPYYHSTFFVDAVTLAVTPVWTDTDGESRTAGFGTFISLLAFRPNQPIGTAGTLTIDLLLD